MGLGDVYLTAILGFLLGWKAGFLALYIAFVTGAIIGIGMMVAHKKKIKSRIPFGPFLVTGTILMIFWGDKALEVIKSIYGF
jgi:prepilin signal peptidase PulO-like enzyme (type II secretory pathway)